MRPKGIGQRLVLATVLAAGFVVVWGLVGIWAAEVGTYILVMETGADHLAFLADGTPRVASFVGRHGEQAYRDLEGNPIPPAEIDDQTGWLAVRVLPAALPAGKLAGDFTWDERVRAFADGRIPAGYWYFVTDSQAEGTGYFVGYDSKSHGCLGYLGTAGLRAEPPAAEESIPFGGSVAGLKARVFSTQPHYNPTAYPSFPPGGRAPRGSISTWDVYVLGRDGQLYHADLQNRTVYLAPAAPGIRAAGLVTGPPDPVRGSPNRLAARTDDAVLVLDERGGILQRYPVPEALRGRDISFAETNGGEGLMYWNSPFDSLATQTEYQIYWVNAEGGYREARMTLPAAGAMRPFQVLGGAVVPVPLVLGGLVGIGRTGELLEEGLEATYPEALQRAVAEFWPALLLAQLFAAGLAVLCYRRQVRYGASGAECLVWPLFVGVLGLAGWVGYRFGRSWPVLASCPACAVEVPRDRGICLRCTAEFPRPALKGTEVFA